MKTVTAKIDAEVCGVQAPASWTSMGLLKSAIKVSLLDNVQRMSAALAYYTIFSLAPLLVITISVAGVVFGRDAAQGEIVRQIQGLIGPESAKAIQSMIQSAYHPGHSIVAAVIGILTLLFGATGTFNEVHDALNQIWRVDPKSENGIWSLIKTRFLSFGMILIIGFLLLVSLVLSAALAGLSKYAVGVLPVPSVLLHAADFILSLLVITALFAMIFKILPAATIEWRDVWMGAVLTALLFSVGKFLIGFYVGKSVSASSYGAAGSLLVVVAWIYYSALILYFGAEFTHAHTQLCRSRSKNDAIRK